MKVGCSQYPAGDCEQAGDDLRGEIDKENQPELLHPAFTDNRNTEFGDAEKEIELSEVDMLKYTLQLHEVLDEWELDENRFFAKHR